MSDKPDEIESVRVHTKALTEEEVKLLNLHSETVERLSDKLEVELTAEREKCGSHGGKASRGWADKEHIQKTFEADQLREQLATVRELRELDQKALAAERKAHGRDRKKWMRDIAKGAKLQEQLAAHAEQLDTLRELREHDRKQLAAEREQFMAGQVIAQRLLRVVEQLPDVKHNSPNFLQTIKELQEACKAIPTNILDVYVTEQLAAERHKREACEVLIRDLQKELAQVKQ